MKWRALAVAVAVLAITVGAAALTMRNSRPTVARVIPSTATSVLDPVKRALSAKPNCQDDGEGDDKSGDDRSSERCDHQAGDDSDSGGGDNEPDEKDSGD